MPFDSPDWANGLNHRVTELRLFIVINKFQGAEFDPASSLIFKLFILACEAIQQWRSSCEFLFSKGAGWLAGRCRLKGLSCRRRLHPSIIPSESPESNLTVHAQLCIINRRMAPA